MGDSGIVRPTRLDSAAEAAKAWEGVHIIACVTVLEIGGEEVGAGGAALGGAGAFDGILHFFGPHQQVFFGSLKKGLNPSGPGPSDVSTSKTKTNIHFLPFSTGHEGGSRVRACCTRCM